MTAKKKSESYRKVQFNLPLALTVALTELVGELRAEAQRLGNRVPTLSEIATDALRKEIRRQRRAFKKRQESAESE